MSGVFPIGGRGRAQRAAQHNRENIGRAKGGQGMSISTHRFERPETSSYQRLPAYEQRDDQHVTREVSGYVSDANQEKQIRLLLSQEDKEHSDFTSRISGRSFNKLLTEMLKSKISMSAKTVILQHLQAKAHVAAQQNENIFACWHGKDFCDTMLILARAGLLDSSMDNSIINEAITELFHQILLKLKDPELVKNFSAKGIEIIFYCAHFIHTYDRIHGKLENAILEQSICVALKNKDKLSMAHLSTHGKILDSLGKKVLFCPSYIDNVKELIYFMLNERAYKKSSSKFCFQFVDYLYGISNLTKKAMFLVEEVTEVWQFIIKKLADNYTNVNYGSMGINHHIKLLSAISTLVDLELPLSSELEHVIELALTNIFFLQKEINNASIAALYCSLSTLVLKKVNLSKLTDATVFFSNKLNSLEQDKTSFMKFEFLTKGTLNWLNLLKSNQEELKIHRSLISNLLFKTTYLSIQNPNRLVTNINLEELLFSLFMAYHDLALISNTTFKKYLFQFIDVFSEKGSIARISRFTDKLNEFLMQYTTTFAHDKDFSLLVDKLINYQSSLLKEEPSTLSRKISMVQTLVSLAKNTSLEFSGFVDKLNELLCNILPNLEQASVEDKARFINTIGSVGQAIKNINNAVAVISQIINNFFVYFPASINLTAKELSLILHGLMGVHLCLEEIKENQDIVLLKGKINSYINDLFTEAESKKYLSEDLVLFQISLPMVAIWLGIEYPITEKIRGISNVSQSQISHWQSAIFNAVRAKYPIFTIEQEISIKGLPEVDILLRENKIIVEIQGPHHYVADRKDLYLTTSLLKKKLYTKLGYVVKDINLMNCPTVKDAIKETLRQLEIEFERPSRRVVF